MFDIFFNLMRLDLATRICFIGVPIQKNHNSVRLYLAKSNMFQLLCPSYDRIIVLEYIVLVVCIVKSPFIRLDLAC